MTEPFREKPGQRTFESSMTLNRNYLDNSAALSARTAPLFRSTEEFRGSISFGLCIFSAELLMPPACSRRSLPAAAVREAQLAASFILSAAFSISAATASGFEM